MLPNVTDFLKITTNEIPYYFSIFLLRSAGVQYRFDFSKV